MPKVLASAKPGLQDLDDAIPVPWQHYQSLRA